MAITSALPVLSGSVTAARLRSYLNATPSVDEVGVTERVASLGTRSIKHGSKMDALLLAVQMMDLTTLEGQDTRGKVRQLASKAVRPDPLDPSIPSVAALCVYPAMVPTLSTPWPAPAVHVASVATYFPSGQVATALKIAEVEAVVDEVPTRSTW